MRLELFSIDQLEPGKVVSVTVEDIAIAVVRSDDVGEVRAADGYLLLCPWHGIEFDSTGRTRSPSRTALSSSCAKGKARER